MIHEGAEKLVQLSVSLKALREGKKEANQPSVGMKI